MTSQTPSGAAAIHASIMPVRGAPFFSLKNCVFMLTDLSNLVCYIGSGLPITRMNKEVLISRKIDAWWSGSLFRYFSHWLARLSFFWLIFFSVVIWVGKITTGILGVIPPANWVKLGTAFADTHARLSSDLQLLARPKTPPVDTLVGFFLARSKCFGMTLISEFATSNQIKKISKFRYYFLLRLFSSSGMSVLTTQRRPPLGR